MKGIAIITQEKEEDLVRIFLSTDNTHAPMGSGGYEVREVKNSGKVKALTFTECDCAPAGRYVVLVEGGIVYANKFASEIMSILNRKGILLRTELVDLPKYLETFLERHLQKKE